MSLLLPGFAAPVAQAQACFRAVLDAMAHPGRIVSVDAPTPPPPLAPATAGVLLTLLDADTPVWLDPDFRPAADWLAFHCGAPPTEVADAAFVIAGTMPELSQLDPGTNVAPERAATLVLQVAGFGRGMNLRLAGPGLPGPATLAVSGLPEDFAAQWQANRARFPRGVDVILCAGDCTAALPRSVEIG